MLPAKSGMLELILYKASHDFGDSHMVTATHNCPKCGSIIYSRRNVLCGICGEQLPKNLLFTPEERAKVERDLENLKQREKDAVDPSPYAGDFIMNSGDFSGSL